MTQIRNVVATYRLQFNSQFTFADARGLVPYLHQLGVSDIYASPIFQAREGSPHGYDAIDPSRLNPELGTEEDFNSLVTELQDHQLGLILDIVPNHLAASPDNPWWGDLLESGPASPFASFFDVDWNPASGAARDQIVLPVLGKPYNEVLENGELSLCLDDQGLGIRYYSLRLPLEVKSYALVLAQCLAALGRDQDGVDLDRWTLEELIGTIEILAPYHQTRPEWILSRHLRAQQVKRRLAYIEDTSPSLSQLLEEVVHRINGERGNTRSFDLLDELLAQQAYRLNYWRTGQELGNYRRFFDISDLAGVRVEVPEVFNATHELPLRLMQEGKVTGLRIDHIDGLREPVNYLLRLQSNLASLGREQDGSHGFYLVVEKILASDESLPPDWPVAGTTGYDFLNYLNGLFVDRTGFERLEAAYRRTLGSAATFRDLVYEKKKLVIRELFASETLKLGQQLGQLTRLDRYASDLPREELERGLVELTACLPVYRTYITAEGATAQDREYIERARQEARLRSPTMEERSLDFIVRVLLGEWPDWLTREQRRDRQDFVFRWQQFTGPVMAKGGEDTALYLYNPLISLNEVGGESGVGRLSVDAFHRHNQRTQTDWPYTLNATGTHDTKRSADVRARINVLSEMPEVWERALGRWRRFNQPRKAELRGELVPDLNTEILLYQTLLGAWPLARDEVPQFKERLQEYLVKAAREAKVRTSWRAPNQDYENALSAFVEGILENSPDNRFLPDFASLQRRVAWFGMLNSLAQTLLHLTAPGIPDLYRGAGLWDFSLVDPDNRRPVDFARRQQALEELLAQEIPPPASSLHQMLTGWEDGTVKLYVTYGALQARQEWPDLFSTGQYLPLSAPGARVDNLCAFARRHADQWVLVATPRWPSRLVRAGRLPLGPRVWGRENLLLPDAAPRRWTNRFTGESLEIPDGTRQLPLSQVFSRFPVALLVAREPNC